ncbi:hypothetical protein LTR96_011899, partial [Exophiala xenobiotica]
MSKRQPQPGTIDLTGNSEHEQNNDSDSNDENDQSNDEKDNSSNDNACNAKNNDGSTATPVECRTGR